MAIQSEDPSLRSILGALAAISARLTVEGDVLRCHVPCGSLPPELAKQIRASKPSLLRHLRRAQRPPLPPFEPVREQLQAPLSCAQERIWVHGQLHPVSLFYEIPLAVRIRGWLDVGEMQRAWAALVKRQPSLRTVVSIGLDGLPVQEVVREATELLVVDWSQRELGCSADLADELRAAAGEIVRSRGSNLALARLYRLGEADWILLVVLHHMVADGWSLSIVVGDLIALYARAEPAPLEADCIDFAQWQRAYLESPAFEHDIAYWKSTLCGAPERVQLGRSDQAAAPSSGRVKIVLDADFQPRIAAWARRQNGSAYSFMLASWAALLHVASAQKDLVIGTVVAARPHVQFERVVGCFMNTLPVRVQVTGSQTFIDLHARVNDALLSAYEHQWCPIDRIVAAVNPSRSVRNPLFNTALLLQNFPRPDSGSCGFDAELLDVALDGLGGLELRMVGAEVNGEFRLLLEYDPKVVSQVGAQALLSNYLTLMRTMLESSDVLVAAACRRLSWGDELPRRRTCGVAATFTAEPLQPAFDYWRESLDIPYVLEFAPYAQVMQELLDPSSLLRTEVEHACVLLNLGDWLPAPGGELADLRLHVDQFIEACQAYCFAAVAPLTVWFCPTDRDCPEAVCNAIDEAEARIADSLRGVNGAHTVTRSAAATLLDFGGEDCEVLQGPGHVPYAPRVYTALGTLVARELAARTRPPLKAVVLDADNTLWRGVCAEDGIDGIEVDEPARELQRFFLGLRAQGVALCLCSKNAMEDVRDVFERHAGMLLRWSDLSAARVNWQPKSANICVIADTLGIGLDSIVFIDDSPAETAEVEAACPAVRCVTLPEDRSGTSFFLHGIWEFDVRDVSGAGARRLETYALRQVRDELRDRSSGIDDYIAALQVKATLRPMAAVDIERASELTQRTNQFNFTGRRRTPTELTEWLRRDGHGVQLVEVTDRFGDYGIAGALMYQWRGTTCLVDNFVLSCRVLGRKVEHAVLEDLKKLAAAQGMDGVEIDLVPTVRNEPACRFADDVLGTPAAVAGTTRTYRVALTHVPMAAA